MGLTGRTGLLMLSGLVGRRYYQRVRATRPIAYWPLWEPSGAVAHDISGNGFHGSYTGVDLGQPGIGDGRTAPFFDGVTDFVNVYSDSLRDAFNGNEGSFMAWVRVSDIDTWSDGEAHRVVHIEADDDNYLEWRTGGATHNRLRLIRRASATQHSCDIDQMATTDWLCLVASWSVATDTITAYLNGIQQGDSQADLRAWAGTLVASRTVIGAYSTTPVGCWRGWLAHVAVWDRPLTPGEVARLARA